jgi:hypothetical protein
LESIVILSESKDLSIEAINRGSAEDASFFSVMKTGILRNLLRPRRYFYLRSRRNKQAFGMTSRHEQHWLRTYAAETYRGTGAIVDLGCFLGATTISLAEGLALNSRPGQKQIHAYDLFNWDERFELWAKDKEVEGHFTIDGSFLPEFLKRTEKWRDYIVVHEEDLSQTQWQDGAIEFLFVDAMKSPETASAILRGFFPYLLPGRSYVAHQDFAHCYTPVIHLITFRLRDYFSVAADVPGSGTTVFRCEKELLPKDLEMDLSLPSFSKTEIEAAFDYSLGLVTDEKKTNIIAAKAMAYRERGDIARAREIVTQSQYGPESLGGELERVKGFLFPKCE